MRTKLLISVLILLTVTGCTMSTTKTVGSKQAAESTTAAIPTIPPTSIAAPTATPTEQSDQAQNETNTSNTNTSNSSSGSASGSNTVSGTRSGVVKAPPCSMRTDWPVYTVVAGDTLASIARRINSTVTVLAEANCLDNPNTLFAGQQIHVPSPVPVYVPPTPAPVYVPPTPVPGSSGLTTFSDHQMGLAFDYPAAWYHERFTVGLASGVTFSSFDPATGPPAMAGWDATTIEFKVWWVPASPNDISAWVEAEKQQLLSNPGLELYEEVQIPLPYGHTGIKLVLVSGSGHAMTRIYTAFNGRNIMFDYIGAPLLAESVLNSLRPVN